MSKKTKIIATLMAMCLVISLGVIGILAVRTLNMKIGGNITFNAEGIAFTVGEGKFYEDDATTIYTGISSQTGKMQGFSMDTDTKLTDVSEAIATWTDLELGLDNRGDAILKFNVSNDMDDKDLYVVFDITHGTNTNDNMVITTQLLQTIPASDDKDIEIKFDILDMDLNAGLEDFEISVTFTDKVQANNSGTVTNNTTTALTNVKYTVTDATKKEVSATPVADDISGAVVIPKTLYIDGLPYTVTSIPEGAFRDCGDITSVYIPSTIETIGEGAFADCTSIMTVQLSEGIKNIQTDAFSDCYMISGELVIPDSVEAIGDRAFFLLGDESNVKLTLGRNIKTIGEATFNSTTIYCDKLIIPDKVETIGDTAFAGVNILDKYIYIPKSVKSIGRGAFDCRDVESITVEQGNTTYHSAGNCLIETSSGTLIQGFKTSVVPTDNSIKVIGDSAFYCIKIKNIYIPKSVIKIENSAFYNTDSESVVVENGNTTYHSAGNCLIETASGKLILGCKNSVIPNDGSIKIIGSKAFYDCSIKHLTIPASVTKFEDEAVDGCYNLIEIVIEAITPPILEERSSIGVDCSIYVPAGSVNAYKTANNWGRVADKIFAIGS